MSSQAPKTQPLRTGIKSLRMLEAVAESEGPVRVSELGRQLGWSPAAVHQQLVTLASAGWVEQSSDGSYRLTLRSARVGQAAMRQAGIGERLMPAMEQLVEEVREAVSLAILEGGSATIIQRIEPGRRLQVDLRSEARMPINRSASGRVLMAHASTRQRSELTELGVEFPAEAVMADIRRAGYAISTGQWMDGVVGIAAPVFGIEGDFIGALSLAGPVSRLDVQTAVSALSESTREINATLAGREPRPREERRE